MHGATECADHAGGYARFKTERISDRDHQLAYSQILGICQAHVLQLWRIDANDGEIGIRVIACQLGWVVTAVRQINGDSGRVVNDVAVRQNESIGRDHKSGAVSAEFPRSRSCADALFYVYVDYGWRYACDCAANCARMRVEQFGVIRLCLVSNWL